MNNNLSSNSTPQFRVLSDGQRQELYQAALECLERVGVLVNSEQARGLFAAAGARVEGNHVYLPQHIVPDALARLPRRFTLWGRDPQRALQVDPGSVYFGPGPSCTNFIDPESGERRKARRGDAGLTARVCDALANVDFVMGLSLFDDVQPDLSPVYEFAELLANTGKPLVAWANHRDNLKDIYAMAAVVAGGPERLRERPIFAYFATYESPLRLSREGLENMLWAAGRGIPVVYMGGPTMGLESPATGASALVLYLAAALSGVAAVQLLCPGAATAIGAIPSAMDLRTARPAYGSPEMALHVAAAAELARFLGVPYMGTAGASESKRLDAQSAAEAAMQILAAALSGGGLVHDLGFLDCADIGSLEYLVFLDEVIAMVKRFMRGVPVSKETILLDLVEEVGPGGMFIAEPRSAALCRGEIWMPQLFDRNAYAIWEQQGKISLEQRVRGKVQRILRSHRPPELPEGVGEEIEAIIKKAEGRRMG